MFLTHETDITHIVLNTTTDCPHQYSNLQPNGATGYFRIACNNPRLVLRHLWNQQPRQHSQPVGLNKYDGNKNKEEL